MATGESTRTSPIRAVLTACGAVFEEKQGRETAAHFGNLLAEYRAVRESAGISDRSDLGRIRVTGGDRLRFVGGMVTNRVQDLLAGAWNHACVTDAQGHTLADLWIYNPGDSLVVQTQGTLVPKVIGQLDNFLIADDVVLEDVTGEVVVLGLQGPRSGAILEDVLADPQGLPDVGRMLSRRFEEAEIVVVRGSGTSEGGFELWAPPERAAPLWEGLVRAGASPVGTEALEILRVESGMPRYGVDVDERVTPLECGLSHTVDFDKGCYIGQETIAKMHFRGKPRWVLVGVRIRGEARVEAGTEVRVDGKAVGRLTRTVDSPDLGGTIGLATVRRGFEEEGQALDLGGGMSGHVAGLPFAPSDSSSNAP